MRISGVDSIGVGILDVGEIRCGGSGGMMLDSRR